MIIFQLLWIANGETLENGANALQLVLEALKVDHEMSK